MEEVEVLTLTVDLKNPLPLALEEEVVVQGILLVEFSFPYLRQNLPQFEFLHISYKVYLFVYWHYLHSILSGCQFQCSLNLST